MESIDTQLSNIKILIDEIKVLSKEREVTSAVMKNEITTELNSINDDLQKYKKGLQDLKLKETILKELKENSKASISVYTKNLIRFCDAKNIKEITAKHIEQFLEDEVKRVEKIRIFVRETALPTSTSTPPDLETRGRASTPVSGTPQEENIIVQVIDVSNVWGSASADNLKEQIKQNKDQNSTFAYLLHSTSALSGGEQAFHWSLVVQNGLEVVVLDSVGAEVTPANAIFRDFIVEEDTDIKYKRSKLRTQFQTNGDCEALSRLLLTSLIRERVFNIIDTRDSSSMLSQFKINSNGKVVPNDKPGGTNSQKGTAPYYPMVIFLPQIYHMLDEQHMDFVGVAKKLMTGHEERIAKIEEVKDFLAQEDSLFFSPDITFNKLAIKSLDLQILAIQLYQTKVDAEKCKKDVVAPQEMPTQKKAKEKKATQRDKEMAKQEAKEMAERWVIDYSSPIYPSGEYSRPKFGTALLNWVLLKEPQQHVLQAIVALDPDSTLSAMFTPTYRADLESKRSKRSEGMERRESTAKQESINSEQTLPISL